MAIKDKFKALAIGGAMLTAALPFTANADDNYANKPQAQTIATSQIQVPFNNIMGVEEDAVRSSAAAQSKDGQVVIFFGIEKEAGQAAYKALQEIIAEGSTAFKGMYIADPLEVKIVNGYKINRAQEIVTYAGMQATAALRNPNKNVGKALKDQLRKDYQEIIIPRRTLISHDTTPKIVGGN